MSSKNDPSISRKYNYVYVLVNRVNGKQYIGVHRTDNLDDGYMGSGKLIKRAISKYGKQNFSKTVVASFESYKQALEEEKRLVTLDYANRPDTYNIREGGYGPTKWSEKGIQLLSESKKKLWADPQWRASFSKRVYTPDRALKISKALLGKSRINSHNKDAEKIRKTADAHRGMKRTATARQNMSNAAQNLSVEAKSRRSGIGKLYMYNPSSNERKRITNGDCIPDGWVAGSGPKNIRPNSFWIYNCRTDEIKRVDDGTIVPCGWSRGRKPKH